MTPKEHQKIRKEFTELSGWEKFRLEVLVDLCLGDISFEFAKFLLG